MHRIPADLDLSKIVGEFTTLLGVGQFDLQFTFGEVDFAIQSRIKLIRHGEVVGTWQEGGWPSATFFDLMNAKVARYDIPDDQTIVIHLENGIEMHLRDDSDQYESMQITIRGEPSRWVLI